MLIGALCACLTIAPAAQADSTSSSVEAESMSLTAGAGTSFADSTASGGRALLIWSNGSASAVMPTTGLQQVWVKARGDQCAGAPRMVVSLDGRTVMTRDVTVSTWTVFSASVGAADGPHMVTVAFINDYGNASCDRNLRVDKVTLTGTSPNPFTGAKWFIDPNSNARKQADTWRATRPADAAQMDKIAGRPQADWFGDWSGDIRSVVSTRVSQITAAGALPVLVAYNIPQRDCGSYSSGGATSAAAYKTWIRTFAAGIGARRAVVVLEPDAIAGMNCLSATDQQTRLSLLSDAVSVLSAQGTVATYLDGGNSNWQPPATMATRLKSAGVAGARGFFLNVSNFRTTASELSYGDQLSALLGGKHFVVDTSRNGLGPTADSQWCNPAGRALGNPATTATGDALADAFFWIKRPGESDGTCNGGPAAGQWWAAYALGLAQRAAY
jgi:Glycosyl hydrolases family 6/Ca-dependent carbohydrate-binding module xylan-binding